MSEFHISLSQSSFWALRLAPWPWWEARGGGAGLITCFLLPAPVCASDQQPAVLIHWAEPLFALSVDCLCHFLLFKF